jgi:hypothetical protein
MIDADGTSRARRAISWLPAVFRGMLSCNVAGAILGVFAQYLFGGRLDRHSMASHLLRAVVWGLAVGVGLWEAYHVRPRAK